MNEKLVDPDWLKTNFPCMLACPVHTNAGGYVALIAEGRFEEAYRLARELNPLASSCGRVCSHPCETACRRAEIDRPIAIRALKRFLTDRHGPEGRDPLKIDPTSVRLSRKVAVVGGGPAGLSAAHDLGLLGYSVTIFEASPAAGGMLSFGVPQYRLPRPVVDAEVREILAAGAITLRVHQAAGRDFTVTDLRRQGFDAVLIAVGAQRGQDLAIPGMDLSGVSKGVDFLRNVNAGRNPPIGTKVIVIGGGDVAMDVARTARREGRRRRCVAPEVHIVCLEQRDAMPAARAEIEAAEAEGAILHPGLGPQRLVGRDGKVAGLATLQTKWVFDAEGRFNPAFHEGTESELGCDTVIVAIGQTTQLDFLRPEDGVEVSPRGFIVVDPETLMTSAPGVFAGGDCVFGPRLLIDGIADGKRAAAAIDAYLARHPRPEPAGAVPDVAPGFSPACAVLKDGATFKLGQHQPIIEVEILDHHQMPPEFMAIPPQPIPMLPIEQRMGNTEVEVGYDEASARLEASRCLRCWINTVFEGSEAEGSRCTLCGGCVDVCPENCLQLVSLDRIEFDPRTLAALRDNPQLLGVELDDVAADELGVIAGSVMLKDETRCTRCGLCAQRCPVKTITMEAWRIG
jgi:NADPH-dependent glutamate synthase beta subunit-like oxidoreductase/ferredoxin